MYNVLCVVSLVVVVLVLVLPELLVDFLQQMRSAKQQNNKVGLVFFINNGFMR
jgi:threonine/homoserine/homoserine lactone efflux protein